MAVDAVGDGFQGFHGSLVQYNVLAASSHATVNADGAPVNGFKRDVELILLAGLAPELFYVLSYGVVVITDGCGAFECREVVHAFSIEDFLCCCFFRAF